MPIEKKPGISRVKNNVLVQSGTRRKRDMLAC
jgi:hypothetical protein